MPVIICANKRDVCPSGIDHKQPKYSTASTVNRVALVDNMSAGLLALTDVSGGFLDLFFMLSNCDDQLQRPNVLFRHTHSLSTSEPVSLYILIEAISCMFP